MLLPYDVMIRILDHITRNCDWATRGALLVAYPMLREHTLSLAHMRLLLRATHARGCDRLQSLMRRPLPSTLSPSWFQRTLEAAKPVPQPDPLPLSMVTYFYRCSLCGRFVFNRSFCCIS